MKNIYCHRCNHEWRATKEGDMIATHYSDCVLFDFERHVKWQERYHHRSVEAKQNEKRMRLGPLPFTGPVQR